MNGEMTIPAPPAVRPASSGAGATSFIHDTLAAMLGLVVSRRESAHNAATGPLPIT